jgi:transcriptional regulator with XRE-family HTH domain
MKNAVLIRPTTELRGLGAAARRCGVSHTHLRKVLQGERKPSAELASKMRKLGLSAGQMKEGV